MFSARVADVKCRPVLHHWTLLCSYIFLVLFNFEKKIPPMRQGRQWCNMFHYHWWLASIKPRMLFFSCRICFLRANPFLKWNNLLFYKPHRKYPPQTQPTCTYEIKSKYLCTGEASRWGSPDIGSMRLQCQVYMEVASETQTVTPFHWPEWRCALKRYPSC